MPAPLKQKETVIGWALLRDDFTLLPCSDRVCETNSILNKPDQRVLALFDQVLDIFSRII